MIETMKTMNIYFFGKTFPELQMRKMKRKNSILSNGLLAKKENDCGFSLQKNCACPTIQSFRQWSVRTLIYIFFWISLTDKNYKCYKLALPNAFE